MRAGWVALVIVLVAGAGVAAAVPRTSSPRGEASTPLVAANLGESAAPADQITTTTVPAAVHATTPPTTTTAQPTTTRATTVRAAPTTRATTVTTTAPAAPTSQSGVTTTTLAMAWAPYVPLPVNPPVWTFEENGVFARVRMTPLVPHPGDTLQFTIESWTDVPGRTCCNVILTFGQDIVYRRWPAPGPCPAPPPREDRASYRIIEPMVLPIPMPVGTLGFLLNVGSTFDPCAGLQEATISGYWTVPVVVRMPGF